LQSHLKELVLSGATLALAEEQNSSGIDGELNFILIGNHAAATWNPRQGRLREITVEARECEEFDQRARQVIAGAARVSAESVWIDSTEKLDAVLEKLSDPARAASDRSDGRTGGPVATTW
jgi:hypothetical protein